MEPTLTQRITRIVAAFHAASFRQLALSTGASEAEVVVWGGAEKLM